ncbi:sensor histidine kinase [Bacterioplanoides sp.]|uniref:sensor histidine kinase n=1 Tax=Bacterioplanoides sp. TaxID=2066072 RepID=UPI003B5C14EE
MRIVSSEFLVKGQRLLRFYSYYSLFLALFLTIVDSLDSSNIIIGGTAPNIFLVCVSLYVIVAAGFVTFASRNPNPQTAISYVFIEIAILATLMYASGGTDSGFSSLILIPVVISNLLAPGVLGLGVAAWTSIAVFYIQLFWLGKFTTPEIVNAGLKGLLFFTLATITQGLSKRLQSTLSLADQQATRIRRLQHFSKKTLQGLPSGVIACDKNHQVLLYNHQAAKWFTLFELAPLPGLLQQAKTGSKLTIGQTRLILNRVPIEQSEPGDYLLYLEDSARIDAEAQQLKLASLGRLTASIAHEIRNPLSALRQASQLLAETDYLKAPEQKLTHIIEQHCMRINRTIEDILQLSRRTQACRETLKLKPWLQHFKEHFTSLHQDKSFRLELACDEELLIHFDPDHLQQILHNLCSNGLRHAWQQQGPDTALQLQAIHTNNRLQLRIMDNGPGVSDDQQEHLFEPFYTTEHDGTGLGLYLSRELCEANQATIQYIRMQRQTCFIIESDPIQPKNQQKVHNA